MRYWEGGGGKEDSGVSAADIQLHGSISMMRQEKNKRLYNLRLTLVDCGGIRMDDANIHAINHGSVDSRTASWQKASEPPTF